MVAFSPILSLELAASPRVLHHALECLTDEAKNRHTVNDVLLRSGCF